MTPTKPRILSKIQWGRRRWKLKRDPHCTVLVITASTTWTSSSSPSFALLAYHQPAFHYSTMMTPLCHSWNFHFPRKKSSSSLHGSRPFHDRMNFHSRRSYSASPTRISRGLICFELLLIPLRSFWNSRIAVCAREAENFVRHGADSCDSWARRRWIQYRLFR